VIGLTSPDNWTFVTGLGHYDRVVPYDSIGDLPADRPVVFVDMAGNGSVRDAVHRRCGDQLRYSCSVGLTHREAMAPAPADLPGAAPAFFFAPDRVVQRTRDWGPAELQRRIGTALKRFVDHLGRWMRVRHDRGADEVTRVYLAMLDGKADPAVGHILSL
jgi:hypothetical protein